MPSVIINKATSKFNSPVARKGLLCTDSRNHLTFMTSPPLHLVLEKVESSLKSCVRKRSQTALQLKEIGKFGIGVLITHNLRVDFRMDYACDPIALKTTTNGNVTRKTSARLRNQTCNHRLQVLIQMERNLSCKTSFAKS